MRLELSPEDGKVGFIYFLPRVEALKLQQTLTKKI